MKHVRPIAKDVSRGWPIVAAHYAHDDRAARSHAAVTHSHAALAFYTGGELRMEQNGVWNLRPGDVLLVPPGEPHRMLDMRGATFWGVGFCVPCFVANGSASLLEPFERVRDGASAVVHIPEARHGYLEGLVRELAATGKEPRIARNTLDAVQRSLLTLILAEVDRASSLDAPRAPRQSVVVEALRFIERRCLERVTLKDVAAAVGRSPTYVTTALSKSTGRSAGEWIVSGRMAEARRLLLHSEEMVDVIAERVGYADATHFIRMFRRQHGATPAAWRLAQGRSS
jgi:AraC family transcriptional regulator, transcriptional activator of pobA